MSESNAHRDIPTRTFPARPASTKNCADCGREIRQAEEALLTVSRTTDYAGKRVINTTWHCRDCGEDKAPVPA